MEKAVIREWFDFDKRLYFLFICLSYIALMFVNQEFILYDSLYIESLGEQMSYARVLEQLELMSRFAWLNYLILPLLILLRIFFISICLMTGVFLLEYSIRFKRVFQIVLIAETVYLLPILIKTGWFLWIDQDYTLEELTSFDFYSLVALLGPENISEPFLILAYSLNLIELLYLLVLAYGFFLVLEKKSYSQTLGFVISSYGAGFLLWIAGLTFLIIHYTA